MAHVPERVLIWGSGGHGKVVADVARACGYELAGYVDADVSRLGLVAEPGGGLVVLAQDDFIAGARAGRLPDGIDVAALAIGRNSTRVECLALLGELPIPPLVHPSAIVSPSVAIGLGTVVMPRAAINAAARVGAAVIVNTGAIIEHDCVVGDGAHLSPGSVLAGGVRVGDRSWVGAGAVVIQGVSIGADVIVGAGAVVVRDVPDGARVAGVPARPIRRREGASGGA